MSRSDLTVDLVKAGISGDKSAVKKVAQKLAAEESRLRHHGVAERLRRAMVDSASSSNGFSWGTQIPLPKEDEARSGIQRVQPSNRLADLALEKNIQDYLDEFIEEQQRHQLLQSYGLEPRHRLVLVGPPGNGKTSIAHGLADALAYPLFLVRYESLMTSYLGETAQNLKRLFEFAATQPCVLFFDEFDAIGKQRGDIHESGEIKRVVTSLIQQMDDLPSHCVLIAASNHPELLDRATWRRFQLKLHIPKPSLEQFSRYFTEKFSKLPEPAGVSGPKITEALQPENFSEADEFVLDVVRQWALGNSERKVRSVIQERLKTWRDRRAISVDTKVYEQAAISQASQS